MTETQDGQMIKDRDCFEFYFSLKCVICPLVASYDSLGMNRSCDTGAIQDLPKTLVVYYSQNLYTHKIGIYISLSNIS